MSVTVSRAMSSTRIKFSSFSLSLRLLLRSPIRKSWRERHPPILVLFKKKRRRSRWRTDRRKIPILTRIHRQLCCCLLFRSHIRSKRKKERKQKSVEQTTEYFPLHSVDAAVTRSFQIATMRVSAARVYVCIEWETENERCTREPNKIAYLDLSWKGRHSHRNEQTTTIETCGAHTLTRLTHNFSAGRLCVYMRMSVLFLGVCVTVNDCVDTMLLLHTWRRFIGFWTKTLCDAFYVETPLNWLHMPNDDRNGAPCSVRYTMRSVVRLTRSSSNIFFRESHFASFDKEFLMFFFINFVYSAIQRFQSDKTYRTTKLDLLFMWRWISFRLVGSASCRHKKLKINCMPSDSTNYHSNRILCVTHAPYTDTALCSVVMSRHCYSIVYRSRRRNTSNTQSIPHTPTEVENSRERRNKN